MNQALVTVLVVLSLLQSVRAQGGPQETEENQSTNSEWRDAYMSLSLPMHVCVTHYYIQYLYLPSLRCSNQPTVPYFLQLNSKLDTLATSLETLKSKLEVLDTNLLEHKQDTSAELAHLQTSVTNAPSFLATHTPQVKTKLSEQSTEFSYSYSFRTQARDYG